MTVADTAFLLSSGLVLTAVWVESMVDIARTSEWRRRLADLTAGAFLAALSIPAAVLASLISVFTWPVLGNVAPGPLAWATGLHPTVAVLIAFVIWDGLGWVDHWIGHHTRIGWFTHRPHHGGSRFDLTLALRQSPIPAAGILLLPLVALTGASLAQTAIAVAMSNLWQALIHTEADLAAPRWLRAAVMTPATHWLHHNHPVPVNLGPVLTCWDRFGGTFLAAPTQQGAATHLAPSNQLPSPDLGSPRVSTASS